MESWTSIWTASPEVDLVSFAGAMLLFRVPGIPKMRDVERLLREAYEHGLCSAEEYRDYYRRYISPGIPKKDDITKLREAYEHNLYGTKEYWEYYREYIAPGMIQRMPFTKPPKPKTELDKLIEKARWENEHSWIYRLFHRWKE